MQQAHSLKELVNCLNSQLDEPYKFHLDLVHSSVLKNNNIAFIGYAESIINDIAIVPSHLLIPIWSNIENRNIVKWINKKLYTEILNSLLQEKMDNIKTTFVRLRIATNMALKMSVNLTPEETEEWRQHINDVFYRREFVIFNYYCTEIKQLPF